MLVEILEFPQKGLRQTGRNLSTVFLSSFHAFNKDELNFPLVLAIALSIVDMEMNQTLFFYSRAHKLIEIETNEYNQTIDMCKERKVHNPEAHKGASYQVGTRLPEEVLFETDLKMTRGGQ